MTDFTTWDIVCNLLLAVRWTLVLSLSALVGGGVLAVLLLMVRIGGGKLGEIFVKSYVELFQGTPLLMQLFLAYFGLSMLGMNVPAWLAAGLTMILWAAAFMTEIWRGSVEAIDKGQWEASSGLGFRFTEQLRHVIFPQAIRIAIPPTVGFAVQVIKGTALTSIIGFIELSKAGSVITNASLRPLLVYGLVAAFYFVLCWPLTKASQVMERIVNAPHHR